MNGEVINTASTQVHINNRVLLNGQHLIPRPFRYIMLNKPAGYICSNKDEFYPSVFNLIDVENISELHVAGRLDADTTGMVLITDDGHWSFHITRPQTKQGKVYHVQLASPICEDAVARFKQGIQLQGEDKLTLPATLNIITSNEVELTLIEGRFHQVKRMFAAIGNKVIALHRKQIGAIRLNIQSEQWRYLTSEEVIALSTETKPIT